MKNAKMGKIKANFCSDLKQNLMAEFKRFKKNSTFGSFALHEYQLSTLKLILSKNVCAKEQKCIS